ncbi:MAG: peptidase S26 [Marinobacter sp. T13-3]|uniref:S26 family signal peptidase n=1 Tax=Marinobacter vinifirmus TaxID=355591 RepID=A0A558B6K3_9GAMM|nr:S26 family signal peptidase [Marinobacter vinifirmus]KXS55474.1 MAG: peptidase S26 [Marinobacter sp. T13-3]TVT32140.1 MAG: S26 family signal peptidase [Marinobacter vinifirmus]
MTPHITESGSPQAAPHSRSRHRVCIVLAVLSACGLAALAWASFVQPLPRLIYNPSNSVAVGWYRLDPLQHQSGSAPFRLEVGTVVLTTLPPDAAILAAQRGYLPDHIPLLKRVGAVAPQHVCLVAGQVRIDGVSVATTLSADRLGRPLPSWQLCRRLRPDELFLLSAINPASFDSRYFGPVNVSDVIGIAHPLWLETRR